MVDDLCHNHAMVFPQFSLRQLLWLIGACAVVCLLIAQALHGGGLWVLGVLAAIAAVIAAFTAYAFAFFCLWLFSLGIEAIGNGRRPLQPPVGRPKQPGSSDAAQVRPTG